MHESGLHMLLHLNWKMHKLYDRMFQEIRHNHQLTQNEVDVLLFLSNNKEKNTAMDIVQYRAISKSLISKSVDLLVKRGFIRTQADEKDRRYTRLYITPAAGHIMLMLHRTQNKFFEVVKEDMTAEELEAVKEYFTRLSDSLDKYL